MSAPLNLVRERLVNQHLVGPTLRAAQEVVRWQGVVQSQDYLGAKWGVAQRTQSLTSAQFDRAFAEGTILRTHVLRPTWHFVLPEDIRWLLQLTAPRVHALNAPYYRKLGLDARTLKRIHALFIKTLQGGKQLTRAELEQALARAGLLSPSDDRLRLAYIMMHAELEQVICSGALKGKQHTYALLDERVPPTRTPDREEALAAMVVRYFTSHGPATIRDFVWWSGLTVADTKLGIAAAGSRLTPLELEHKTYWHVPARSSPRIAATTAHLLPPYDEYWSHHDRSALIDSEHIAGAAASTGMFLLIDGKIQGVWKRTVEARRVVMQAHAFTELPADRKRLVSAEVKRYSQFIELPVEFSYG